MITRNVLKEQILAHLTGALPLEDLAAWAEEAFRTAEFDARDEDQISETLAMIRDAVDPHRFRWEEPDFEELLDALDD